jgi:hypothetical protein
MKQAFLKCICLIGGILPTTVYAQNLKLDTSTNKPSLNVIAQYSDITKEQLGIYHGNLYAPYPNVINNGHVFFNSPVSQKSTINYYGIIYYHIDVLYDLLTDQLVVKYPDGFSEIQLLREGVESFSISGHHFIRLDKGTNLSAPATGFYELLYTHPGHIGLLAKRQKKIEETVNSGIRRDIIESVTYYIAKGATYYEISSVSDLRKVLKETDIQTFIKKNKLDFKKDTEGTLIKAVEFYDKNLL